MPSLKQKVFSGVFWQALEKIGSRGITFVVSLVLARLLTPDDFGLLAMLSIFLTVSGVLVDSGFGTALIQKETVTEGDYNSAFYLSLVVSIILYGVLFGCAPAISVFYDRPILCPVLRWAALGVVINAVNGVQTAVLKREMKFNLSFKISLIETISYAVIGLVMALRGYGVWSLIFATLGSSVLATGSRWFLIGWTPRFLFSFSSVRIMFRYSGKLLASAILDTFFSNLYGLVIGKVYSSSDLAFYNRGRALPQTGVDVVDASVANVTFSAFSRLQNDRQQLRATMRRTIQCTCFLVMPIMFSMALCASPLVLVLLGEKWAPAIPFLRIACFSSLLWPFHVINLRAILAVGRSDYFFKMEIIKKLISVAILLFSFRHGVFFLACVGAFLGAPLSVIVNAWPNRKLLDYSLRMQLQDVWPTVILCLIMGIPIFSVSYMAHTPWILLALQVVVGTIVFFSAALLVRNETMKYLLGMVRRRAPLMDRMCVYCKMP